MKNLFFLLLAMVITAGLQAQEPDKDIKKAARLLGTYNLDPEGGADKLDEAISLATSAIKDATVKADPASWQTYGEVHLAAMERDVKKMVLDAEAPITVPDAAANAYKGFKMAAELAQKSYHTKDAMKALSAALQNIYFMGSALFQAGNYQAAYEAFKATYDGFNLVSKNNEPTNFDPAEHPKALYYSGLCAQQAGMNQEAKMAFQSLVDAGNAAPEVYEALIGLSQDNPAEVEALLEAARKKYPDDVALLYAEINHYLQKGEMENLIAKLKKALELEPNNVSVYVTLGQVYDKLYADNIATDPEAAQTYFDEALSYYQRGLDINKESFDAVYSIGALWYNKAAGFSVKLNELSDDYSAEGTRKYEAIKTEMDATFEKALPFFLRAETLQPNDYNTLLALREIYARQEKYDLVEEYKKKIEALGN